MFVFNLNKSSMHSHYYCISNEKFQHAWNTWVLQTLQFSAASIVQCHWHCYKAVLLVILWIHDLLHRFHLSVSRSCLESVHKNVSGFIPTDNIWEKVVNSVVYIFFTNITTFTTLFSVTDIMSFLKQCKQPFYALKPVLVILAATSVSFAWRDGSVSQDVVSSLLLEHSNNISSKTLIPTFQWYRHLAVMEGHVSCRNCDR